MADSYRSVVGQLLTYCPFVPLPLVELWVRDRWRQLCESRKWSFLRGRGHLVVPDVYAVGTLSATKGSATMIGSGTSWTADMVGRQIKLSPTVPVYTIASVVDSTTLTIEDVFLGASVVGNSYSIMQVYFTPPADFLSWISVVNTKNWVKFHTGYFNSEDLDRFDPQRTTCGMPYVLAGGTYRTMPNASPIPMFEMWPWPVTNDIFPYVYWKRPVDFDDDFYLPAVISGDVLVTGALADLSKWPGIEDRKNPLYIPSLAGFYEKRWEFQIGQCGRNDNEIYNQDLRYESLPFSPFSSNYVMTHAMME